MWRGIPPSPRRPRNIDVDVFSTRAINVNVEHRGEINKEQDRVKRRSSVVPPLVQPSIVLLSWLPQDRYCSVLNVLIRWAKQAHDTAVCSGAGEFTPSHDTDSGNRKSSRVVPAQGTAYDMLAFAILYHYDTLSCLLGFLCLDQFLSLNSNDRSVVTVSFFEKYAVVRHGFSLVFASN